AAHTAEVGSNTEVELEELVKDEEALQEDKEQATGDDAESVQIDGDEYVGVDVYDNDYYACDDEEEHMFALTEHCRRQLTSCEDFDILLKRRSAL
ncbi:hypothetical protein C0992_009730, partial [Termitomyces sp. T32_za158]